MEPKQRKTTRWMARVDAWIRATVYFIAEVSGSFLNLKEEDELQVKGIKTADFVVRRAMYFGADHGLTVLSLTIGVTTKALGFSLIEMFATLWVFDFIAAGFFIVIYEVTGKDLSLGEDLRRATDTINGRSRLAGYVAMLWIIILAIVWMGPEKIITFFRKEIGTIRRVVAVLIILTAIQAFIWSVFYWLGYDLVAKLF